MNISDVVETIKTNIASDRALMEHLKNKEGRELELERIYGSLAAWNSALQLVSRLISRL